MRLRIILALSILSGCASSVAPKPAPVREESIIMQPGSAGWTFGCGWEGLCDAATSGTDAIGKFAQTTIHLQSQGVPLTEKIRRYQGRPVALYSVTYEAAAAKPVVAFPDFDHLPAKFHVMSFREKVFSPAVFEPMADGSPWLIFDDADNAFIISPASHFLIQTIGGDARRHVDSELRGTVVNIPAGFTQQTLVAWGHGINGAWDQWGRALTDLEGKIRPPDDADAGLKYLGYWTDNGAHYYYNFDRKLGYGGTLLELARHFRDEQIPVKYTQLDSWWYYKTLTGPDGKTGKPKNAKLPEGEWNRYGGLAEYRAHPGVFPQGLEAFHTDLGMPLITHNRWVDPASPYRQKYQVSGYAAVDPGFWREIIDYIAGAGVITYEQDWLSEIWNHSPELASSVDAGDKFTGGMAQASARDGVTMQYCMAYPGFFMQGSQYANLTTIRCSDDRFDRERWHNFLFTSRLASSLGIWPWCDTYMSSETGNILLSDLSAGMVGFGDAMGKEDKENIFRAVRKDGVIVKPDAPIVPVDSEYIAEANGQHRALVASTYTDHGGVRTIYVLAYRVPPPKKDKNAPPEDLKTTEKIPPATQADVTDMQFSLAEVGVRGPAYVYDFFGGMVRRGNVGDALAAPLGKDGYNYYVIAEQGASGIALFGDQGKFVSSGKQRIESVKEEPGTLAAVVIFAPGEQSIRLHGCCESAVKSSAGGQNLDVTYDQSSGHFSVDLDAKLIPAQASAEDGTRRVEVTFERD